MVLATGRAVLEERVPIGDAVDRALRMLKQHQDDDVAHVAAGKKQPIHIDEVTAGVEAAVARAQAVAGERTVAVTAGPSPGSASSSACSTRSPSTWCPWSWARAVPTSVSCRRTTAALGDPTV